MTPLTPVDHAAVSMFLQCAMLALAMAARAHQRGGVHPTPVQEMLIGQATVLAISTLVLLELVQLRRFL